jgi:hypothetical protein
MATWQDTMGSKTAVISDRLVGANTFAWGDPQTYRSLWSQNGWEGSVAFNDGHVSSENDSILENTQYNGLNNETDDLFRNDSGPSRGWNVDVRGDAFMVSRWAGGLVMD